MKKELEEQLVKDYPNLYKEYGGDMRQTCMHWGMSCGDGWFDIIKNLSEQLEPLGIVAAQVKEKFGGLRFYINPCDSDVFDIAQDHIAEAEGLSYKTCEVCGEAGEPTGGGWVRTLCDKCHNK